MVQFRKEQTTLFRAYWSSTIYIGTSGTSYTNISAITLNAASVTSTNGGNASNTNPVRGIVTSTPYNLVILRNADTGNSIVDGSNRVIFGRITFSGGNYIINYLALNANTVNNAAGTEVSTTLPESVDIEMLFPEVMNIHEVPVAASLIPLNDGPFGGSGEPDPSPDPPGENLARFTINGTPSEDASGNRGYDAVAGQTLTLTLEENPVVALSVQYQLPEISSLESADMLDPLSSLFDTPQFFDLNSGTVIVLGDYGMFPNSSVNVTIDPSTDISSYVIRCKVVTTEGIHVFDRMVVVRKSGLRMTTPNEQQEYGDRGLSDAINEVTKALTDIEVPSLVTSSNTGTVSSFSTNDESNWEVLIANGTAGGVWREDYCVVPRVDDNGMILVSTEQQETSWTTSSRAPLLDDGTYSIAAFTEDRDFVWLNSASLGGLPSGTLSQMLYYGSSGWANTSQAKNSAGIAAPSTASGSLQIWKHISESWEPTTSPPAGDETYLFAANESGDNFWLDLTSFARGNGTADGQLLFWNDEDNEWVISSASSSGNDAVAYYDASAGVISWMDISTLGGGGSVGSNYLGYILPALSDGSPWPSTLEGAPGYAGLDYSSLIFVNGSIPGQGYWRFTTVPRVHGFYISDFANTSSIGDSGHIIQARPAQSEYTSYRGYFHRPPLTVCATVANQYNNPESGLAINSYSIIGPLVQKFDSWPFGSGNICVGSCHGPSHHSCESLQNNGPEQILQTIDIRDIPGFRIAANDHESDESRNYKVYGVMQLNFEVVAMRDNTFLGNLDAQWSSFVASYTVQIIGGQINQYYYGDNNVHYYYGDPLASPPHERVSGPTFSVRKNANNYYMEAVATGSTYYYSEYGYLRWFFNVTCQNNSIFVPGWLQY